MERLGLGPDVLAEVNPKLVFGRMTGFGQDGPLAQARRPRHQLHRAGRRAARHRPQGRGAGAAAQPGRRLRRRRHVPRLRRGVRAAGGAEVRQGPGGRRRHGRRRRLPDGPDVRHVRARRLEATSAASTCSTPARPGTTPTRPRTASGWRSAPSRQRFYAEFIERLGPDSRRPARRSTTASGWPELRRRFAEAIKPAHARRMGAHLRGQRRLRRARAVAGRGRAITRTTPRARTFVERDGVLQPAPAPRFSAARRPRWALRRDRAAPTARPSCATGASRPAEIDALRSAGTIGTAEAAE